MPYRAAFGEGGLTVREGVSGVSGIQPADFLPQFFVGAAQSVRIILLQKGVFLTGAIQIIQKLQWTQKILPTSRLQELLQTLKVLQMEKVQKDLKVSVVQQGR